MKKSFFQKYGIVALLLIFVSPLFANHLDGLWQSDRQQLTLRIELTDEGFRAKRMDQGIWYRYVKQEDNIYVDRYGNWYKVIDEDELIWNEANSSKRIYFYKAKDDNRSSWDNNWDHEDPWDHRDDDRWNNQNEDDHWNHSHIDHRDHIDGRWLDRFNRQVIEIECFKDGYRIKSHHGGWEKYFADRSGFRFRDRFGNSFQILDRNSIRWRDHKGRGTQTFIRQKYESRYHSD